MSGETLPEGRPDVPTAQGSPVSQPGPNRTEWTALLVSWLSELSGLRIPEEDARAVAAILQAHFTSERAIEPDDPWEVEVSARFDPRW